MEWIKKILGYKYLLNKRTGEVHYIPKMGKRCAYINNDNRKLISQTTFRKIRGTWLDDRLINGCKWCNRKHDLG